MALHSRKYRPNSLDEIDFNKPIVEKIRKIVEYSKKTNEFPNMIFSGCPGSGKHVLVECLVKSLFNDNCATKINEHTMTLESNKTVEFNCKTSNYHIEITPSDYGIYDKNILNSFISEIATTKSFSTTLSKIIVINNAHLLGVHAQQILRRLLESRVKTSRFILITNRMSSIIEPVISHCNVFRVEMPAIEDIYTVLMRISKTENVKFTKQAYHKIARVSALTNDIINLNYIFNVYQLSYLRGKYSAYELGYQNNLDRLIEIIKDGKVNITICKDIREILYEFYAFHMEIEVIIKYILNHFLKDELIDDGIKTKMVDVGIMCEMNCLEGNKDMIHMEAFIYGMLHLFS